MKALNGLLIMHTRLVAPHRVGFQRRRLGPSISVLLLLIQTTMTMEKTVSKNDVYDLYRAEKIECESPSEGKQTRSKLHATVILFLITVDPMLKFHTTVQSVINQSIKNSTNWVPRQAARAFRHVEKFALNLVEFPWQREFKTIRLYTGLWKLKIERHLYCVIPLFERMGYRHAEDDTLRLQELASRDTLIELAADCQTASVELDMYGDILSSVEQKGFTLQDVHNCRTAITGSREEAIDWITQNCKPSFRKIHENFEKRASQSDENSLPPMEQLELDERGDSGFISKTNSKELPVSSSNNRIPEEETVTVGKNEYADDFPPPPPLVDEIRIPSTDEEDVFAPKEWEDQIRNSLKFIDRNQAKSEHRDPASRGPGVIRMSGTGGHGSSAEWDHVRQGLRQKFGEDYYAGLRGDILEKAPKNNTGSADYNINSSGQPQPQPQQKASPSSRVITADVHAPTTKPSPSPMSPGSGKIAGIKKSTSRKPAPPVLAKPGPQFQKQNSQLEEFYQQNTHMHAENSSPEISHPPSAPTTFPLLGTHYQAPNFTTFGHSESRGIGQIQCAMDPMLPHDEQQQQDDPALYEILKNPAIRNGTGYEGLTRRMYQADSLQSLNKEDFPPPPPPVPAHEELYSKPIKPVPQYSQPMPQYNDLSKQDGGQFKRGTSAVDRPNGGTGTSTTITGLRSSHTAPIVPRRPAPKVPTRSHQTEPLFGSSSKQQPQPQQQQQQPKSSTPAGPHCRHCTFANSEGATTCSMCSKPFVAPPAASTKSPAPSAPPSRACPKCTYSNPSTATNCKICRWEFSQ